MSPLRPCTCAPSLVLLRRELDVRFGRDTYPEVGCCGDADHAARKSDHNPASSPPAPGSAAGYAHARDVGEGSHDHGLEWFVRMIFDHPPRFPQVKYLIYERRIIYPHAGARPRGIYPYTGLNAHARHCHVSIFDSFTFYAGSWFPPAPPPAPDPIQEEDMRPFVAAFKGGATAWLVSSTGQGLVKMAMGDPADVALPPNGYGPVVEIDRDQLAAIPTPTGSVGDA